MTLLIMAAGMGSRYGGLKQIDPITPEGEFIVDFSVYDAIRAGFDRIVFIIKRENEEIFRETVGARIEGKIKTEYVFQSPEAHIGCYEIPAERQKPWGTGHAVLCAETIISDPFVVINADDFYGAEAFEKTASFLRSIPSDGKEHFCMAGYCLGNTLTENGSVARGICEIDDNGYLVDITERTKIIGRENDAAYEENGKWVSVPLDTTVSMNCWGFTPGFFPYLERYFAQFLYDETREPLKSEFYLPFAVRKMMADGGCDVRVLKTGAKWYGVTYHDDKEKVVAKISELIESGIYKKGLWS